jgi:hypothetical protein
VAAMVLLTLMAKMQAKAMWRKCFISDVMVLVAFSDFSMIDSIAFDSATKILNFCGKTMLVG